MALNLPNFLQAPIRKSEYVPQQRSNPLEGLEDIASRTLTAYHAPQKLKEEREQAGRKKEADERKKKAEELAQRFLETYGARRQEAEINAIERGALSPFGLMLQDRAALTRPEDIEAFNKKIEHDTSLLGRGVGGTGRTPGLTYATKYAMEIADAREGFMPGTNRTVQFNDPEEQTQTINRLELAAQKHATDVQTRQRSLFANNINKAFERTNLDDLTKFSGVQGKSKLFKEAALDSVGKSSEEYKKYQEALTASEAEAKEIRQFLGESITPTIADQLRIMTNPTGLGVSPETAKRKIEKAREIIRAQLKTYQEGLKSTAPYLDSEIPNERYAPPYNGVEIPAGSQSRDLETYRMSDEELLNAIGGG